MWPPWMKVLRDEAGAGGDGGGGNNLPPAAPPANDQTARLEAELARQQGELQKLRMQVTPPVQPPANAQPTKEDIEKQFWKDPLSVVDAMAQRRAIEIAQQAAAHQGPTQDAMRMYARDRARGNDAFQQKVFDHYYTEIEQLVNAVPPNFQTNPNVWDNAFNQVKGRHIDEISQMKSAQPAKVPVGDGPGVPSAKAAPPPAKEPLSEDEKGMARSLRMTEDEYRAGKKAYENQEQAWNEVLTFDSDEKRRKERAAAAARSK